MIIEGDTMGPEEVTTVREEVMAVILMGQIVSIIPPATNPQNGRAMPLIIPLSKM